PYLRVFRGLSKTNLPGYVGFFQFLRNFRHQNAFEQAELILQAALDPAIASRARKGEFVQCLNHFDLLQTAINCRLPPCPMRRRAQTAVCGCAQQAHAATRLLSSPASRLRGRDSTME